MMSLPDDLKDTNSQIANTDYWLVTIPDLDPQSITSDGIYNFIFRWQWEDGTYGKWSVAKELQTLALPDLEVSDVTSSWKVNTLTIKFKGPKVLVNGVSVDYADKFIIELTDVDTNRTHTFTQNLQDAVEQSFILDSKSAQEFYRPTSGTSTYQPKRFTAVIKVHSADGISTGYTYNTATSSSGYGNVDIPDDAWGAAAVLDGYTLSLDWDKLQAASTPILKENFAYANIYEAPANGTEPNTTAGSFSFIKTGDNGTLVYHPDSLASHYIHITLVDKSGNATNISSNKKIKALNPSGFDSQGPSNDGSLTLDTPVVDDNGLFDFNYKFKVSWTAETDTTTSGYRIRWRVSGSNDPYTYTLVPGRLTTSTYLYGVVANTTYEVGKNTLDEYGNTTSSWKTQTVTTGNFSGDIQGTKALKAGNMRLGYGISGKGGSADSDTGKNKGLYLGPSNYWYITGNTVTDSGAYIKIGSDTSNLIFDGTDLSVTGKVYANSGEFTGSIKVGTDTVDGQLKVQVDSSSGIELGHFSTAIPSGLTAASGIYAYSGTNYTLINASDGSIRTNSLYATGTIQTKADNSISTKGAVKLDGVTGAFELLDSSDRVRFGIHGSAINGPAEVIIAADDIGVLNGYPSGSPYIAMVNLKTSLGDIADSKYINFNPGTNAISGTSFTMNQYGMSVNNATSSALTLATFKNIIVDSSTPSYAEVGTIWIQLG